MTQFITHFIDGDWIKADAVGLSLNPSDLRDVVAEVADGGQDILEQAISAAHRASSGWAALSTEARSDILNRAGSLLMERSAELGRLLSREEGKTLAEGQGEVVRAGRIFQYFAGEAIRVHGQMLNSTRLSVEVATRREPLGVVGLITPWNFPMAIPAWKAAPALAFGNTVVMKVASITPATAAALAKVLEDAGIPPGVFNLVFVRGSVAAGLARDHRISALSFTGSTGVGRGLAISAVSNGIRVQLEMGGKNPLVILDDADVDRAVSVALDGAFFGSGQRCTASSRLIVAAGIHDRFVSALTKKLAEQRVGHALDPATNIGPVASQEQLESILSFLKVAREEGAKIDIGGEKLSLEHEGYYLSPALVTETSPEMTINIEEVFGPVASVLKVSGYEEALNAANGTKLGLSAGIVTSSLKYAHDFKRRVEAGMVMVNLPTAGVDYHVPFGGTKESSYGSREQGFSAVEFYTQTKTSYTSW